MVVTRVEADTLTDLRGQVCKLVMEKGLRERPEPFELSSGQMSRYYIDGKHAVSRGPDLGLVSRAILRLAESRGATFDTVGGLTLGADALAHGVALVGGKDWFTVRKRRKEHGQRTLVEGASIEGARVLLVDDIVTTGLSIESALAEIQQAEQVVLAVALVDRSGETEGRLKTHGVPFEALLNWEDLGIPRVSSDGRASS